MRICFSCKLEEYKPKGNVLQFLTMLHALDQKIDTLHPKERRQIKLDCVLPFAWKDGTDGFYFRHTRFFQAANMNEQIRQLDKKERYDFIFIRGREQAIDLVKRDKSVADRLLFLMINYNLKDPRIMKEVRYLWENSLVMFFQSVPLADRFTRYMSRRGTTQEEIERKVGVLPQYVRQLYRPAIPHRPRANLHLIWAGVIRPRYGLAVAVRAMEQIRKEFPKAHLKLLYPSIAPNYRTLTKVLLTSSAVISYGQRSNTDTQGLIKRAGIGLALLYDNTPDKTPSHAYLSRILEYASLGIPVITTKTRGNIDLFGEDYPLFAKNEQDIVACYRKLSQPDFYEQMSRYVYSIGELFIAENAVENLWSTLLNAYDAKRGVGLPAQN